MKNSAPESSTGVPVFAIALIHLTYALLCGVLGLLRDNRVIESYGSPSTVAELVTWMGFFYCIL
jgi:hypothetical protein